MPTIEDEYRRLLHWYPRAWRDENEDVVVGTFLEAAGHRRQAHPTIEDRCSVMFAGLRQRAIGTGQRSPVATIAFAAGVAFVVFYCSPISWDPALTFNGYVGPFTSPIFVIGLLLALALTLNIRRMTAAARVVALLAVLAGIVLGVLAWGFGSLGPTSPAVAVFAAFGAGGLSRSNKILRGILLAAASLCAVFAAFCLATVALQSTYGLTPWWPVAILLAALGIVAASLLGLAAV